MQAAAAGPRKVVYIGGYSRSGSTLLLRLLAQTPDLTAVGELFDIWRRSYRDDQLCGCGEAFRSCPFWRDVTLKAFGTEPERIDWAAYHAWRQAAQGYPAIPRLWIPPLRSRRFRGELARYVHVMERLFGAIFDVGESRVVLESSKVPQFAWILGEMADVEVHMVHLVRDSRATAYSWTRHKVRPEISWKTQAMDRHPVARSALEWDLFNVMLGTQRQPFASYTLVRYEDLVQDPVRELRRIEAAVGEPIATEDLGSGTVSLGTAHTASGNPARFTVGPVKIARDDEWRDKLPPAPRAAVTALTLPGLLRYRYPIGSGST
jgi:hypothetical protein